MKKIIDSIGSSGKLKAKINKDANKAWKIFDKASEKEKKQIFFELVGGQSSFMLPTGKHHQTKLFIKK